MLALEQIKTNINNGYSQVTDLISNRFNFADEPEYNTEPDVADFSFFGFADVVFIQSDGKILVGGQSGLYDNGLGDSYSLVKRFNTDGTLDETFNSPKFIGNSNGFIRDIGQQSDGKLIVVGHFYYADAVLAERIARLNTDGSLDNTFDSSNGFNGNALVCKVLSDDSILVGGIFNDYDSYGSSRLLKLNSDGTINTTFADNVSIPDNVHAIAVDGSGGIYAGGRFTNKIIKLNSDGTTDGSFDVGVGFDDRVYAIKIQSNGKIIVGGWFEIYKGSSCNPQIVRLETNGDIDSSFLSEGTGLNLWSGDYGIQALDIQSDGKIVAVGWFCGYNDTLQKAIVRLNTDGTRDDSFVTGTGFSDRAQDVKIDASGNIFVAGFFYYYNGSPCAEQFNYLDSYQAGGVVKLSSTGALLGTPSKQNIFPVGIEDGERDMFDGGIYINSDLNQPYGSINQSDSLPSTHSVLWFCDASEGVDFATYDISIDNYEYLPTVFDGNVVSSESVFGTGSTYFTNQYPGLFVMISDNISINELSLTGGTGQDGSGDWSSGIFDVSVYGKTYGVFYKTTFGNDSSETNVQQIIIIDKTSDGVTQDFYNPLDSMDQVLNTLSGTTKAFILVFAVNDLAEALPEETINSIAVEFLTVAMYENEIILCTPTTCQSGGFTCQTSTSCVCSKSRLFAPNCPLRQLNANICSTRGAAYVPAITVCRQRLF